MKEKKKRKKDTRKLDFADKKCLKAFKTQYIIYYYQVLTTVYSDERLLSG